MARKLLFLWGFLLILAGSTSGELFTGEYFDDSISLQYNRARFYDPKQGRFISLDTFKGFTRHPITFNPYLYASADSVNNIDPSGMFTLGEIFTVLDRVLTVHSVATGVYDTYFAAPEPGVAATDAPSVWDALFIIGAIKSAEEVAEILYQLATNGRNFDHLGGPDQSHHIIPQYMCGASAQRLVKLSISKHTLLHVQLDTLSKLLELTANRVAKVLKRRSTGKISINDIGKRKLGRVAISAAIGGFYTGFDWMKAGIPAPNHYDTIGAGFGPESAKFIQGATSCR